MVIDYMENYFINIQLNTDWIFFVILIEFICKLDWVWEVFFIDVDRVRCGKYPLHRTREMFMEFLFVTVSVAIAYIWFDIWLRLSFAIKISLIVDTGPMQHKVLPECPKAKGVRTRLVKVFQEKGAKHQPKSAILKLAPGHQKCSHRPCVGKVFINNQKCISKQKVQLWCFNRDTWDQLNQCETTK